MSIVELRFEALKRYQQAATTSDPAKKRRLHEEGDDLTDQGDLAAL